ncbi:hypothetical protein AMJ83_05385 [candidate division WOR_3 bacterium SM23_42]|uniref:Uncharacterized protein n=1 Tax=candidate division WOR_3 bacterium SM23_42 TaxID=1703779 RepID=A0A0S8FT68_UNCW3|nr:MAG: hypothetical protein AMJ83_05385 [candidate division WOR_3 bacterium SM23_42]
MKHVRLLLVLLLVMAFITSCTKENDEASIRDLLESSWYIADGALQNHDDSTQVPRENADKIILNDSIPYVRWVRWIERPVIREYEIIIIGDSADVTIRAHFHGEPPGYGFFVNNDIMEPVYQRAITDSVIRKVKLWKDEGGDWRLGSLTVADIYTENTDYPVTITEIRALVASRNYEFVVNDANTYFEKDELPIFYPGDTVEVTVVCNAQDDSTWAFLHHGTGHRPGIGHHIRRPFYRENTNTFTRTWVIAHDSIIVTPAVRHSATDVIGWQTLFDTADATYYARAWCLPYIVLQPGDEIPEDEE